MKTTIKFLAIAVGTLAVFFFFLTAKAVAQDPAHKISLESKKDTIIKGVTHKLYVGAKGGRYIIVVSKKTGKEYKRYFAKK